MWLLDGILGPISDATQTVSCLRVMFRWSPLPVGPVLLCLATEINVHLKKKRGHSGPFQAVELWVVLNFLSCLF